MQLSTPAIVSFRVTQVTPEVCDLLRDYQPLGVIIMGYNIVNQQQLEVLCEDLRTYVPYVLIDQEGGSVRRLRGAPFYDAKDMSYFGQLYDQNPDQAIAELTQQIQCVAEDLRACNINVNCAPCLDLHYDHPLSEKHVISFYKRAFHKSPEIVGLLGEVVCRTFLESGITPVIKHLPGHGRSTGADPHEGMCQVYGELENDSLPFKHIVKTGLPVWGMSSHVIYDVLDPINPTVSSKSVVDFIRHTIGFKHLLMTDAIDMKALDHMSLKEKVRGSLLAGHDAVLYCAGDVREAKTILETAASMTS